jgi:NAD-dependent SIR2 family protein deacetylase
MMHDYDYRIKQARTKIEQADFLLIGGGAGLSDAAGLHYSGKRFTDNFADFIEKYGFDDLYTSSFYPFKTQEERWAYWAKHISINRYEEPVTELYKDLFRLAHSKEYFVITTNVEHQFIKAGFPEDKVFAVQGDYGFLQCEEGCHNTLYYNEEQVKTMIASIKDCKVPSALVPKCPVCGDDMDVNLRHNDYFVQDENWYASQSHYKRFLNTSKGKRIVFLELGVGYNTPGIIRIPFEQLTNRNKNAVLIRINRDYPDGAKENIDRTIAFTEDMKKIIELLNNFDSKQEPPVSK